MQPGDTITVHADLDGCQAAAAQAKASRERLVWAAQWLIAKAVSGTELTVQPGDYAALITSPAHPGHGHLHIRYAGGAVDHNGTYLGILDGYEPSNGQRIGQHQILTALTGHTP